VECGGAAGGRRLARAAPALPQRLQRGAGLHDVPVLLAEVADAERSDTPVSASSSTVIVAAAATPARLRRTKREAR
jgi:hypothetical protein